MSEPMALADFENSSKGYILGWFMGQKGHLDLETSNVEVAFMTLPERDDNPPHTHVASEITVCLTGALNLIIDGEKLELLPGHFLLVKPWQVLQNPTNAPNTTIVVIKWPSISGDKFYTE